MTISAAGMVVVRTVVTVCDPVTPPGWQMQIHSRFYYLNQLKYFHSILVRAERLFHRLV